MPLPDELRPRYAALQRRLVIPDVRWVEPRNLHMTLKFLGSVDPDRLAAARLALARCAAAAAGSTLRGARVEAFPRARAARVIVVELEDPAGGLPALHGAIDEGLGELGFEREQRRFRLHVTLGRVRRGEVDVRAVLEGARAPRTEWAVGSFALFRSRLEPGGPTYEVIERFALGGPGRSAAAAASGRGG